MQIRKKIRVGKIVGEGKEGWRRREGEGEGGRGNGYIKKYGKGLFTIHEMICDYEIIMISI